MPLGLCVQPHFQRLLRYISKQKHAPFGRLLIVVWSCLLLSLTPGMRPTASKQACFVVSLLFIGRCSPSIENQYQNKQQRLCNTLIRGLRESCDCSLCQMSTKYQHTRRNTLDRHGRQGGWILSNRAIATTTYANKSL